VTSAQSLRTEALAAAVVIGGDDWQERVFDGHSTDAVLRPHQLGCQICEDYESLLLNRQASVALRLLGEGGALLGELHPEQLPVMLQRPPQDIHRYEDRDHSTGDGAEPSRRTPQSHLEG
jgi:hypothetical protein